MSVYVDMPLGKRKLTMFADNGIEEIEEFVRKHNIGKVRLVRRYPFYAVISLKQRYKALEHGAKHAELS
jgi:hypothetical protein